MHIEHINISAPADLLELEKLFFCDVFDLKEGFRPSFPNHGYWLYADEHALVHLTESDEHTPIESGNYLDHVALRLTGIQGFKQRLVEMGIPSKTSNLPDAQMSQVFVYSPAGVRVEANFFQEEPA